MVIPLDLTCPQTLKAKKVQKTGFCSMVHFKSWEKNLKVIISIVNLAIQKQKIICFTYHACQQGGLFSKCPFFFTFAHIYSDAIFHNSLFEKKKSVFSSSFTLRLSLEWKSFIKLYSVLYIVCTFLYKKLYLDMLKDGFGVKRASCSLHLKLVK